MFRVKLTQHLVNSLFWRLYWDRGSFFLNFAPSTHKPHNSAIQIKIMTKKKARNKTDVLAEVSKEIKTEIVNNADKYGLPTDLKVTALPTLDGKTDSGKKQSFLIVDPDECLPYFVCKKCAVPMGPITCHRKCFLQKCKGEDSTIIKKRYTRAVQRLNKIKKIKDDDNLHDKDPKLKKEQRVEVQFEGNKWFPGKIVRVFKHQFRVEFDDGDEQTIKINSKEDEGWRYI